MHLTSFLIAFLLECVFFSQPRQTNKKKEESLSLHPQQPPKQQRKRQKGQQEKKMIFPLVSLPEDALFESFCFLDARSLVCCDRVCKSFHQLTNNRAPLKSEQNNKQRKPFFFSFVAHFFPFSLSPHPLQKSSLSCKRQELSKHPRLWAIFLHVCDK